MATIPVDKLVSNPEQPRTYFDETDLEALAQSIQENTQIVPITVEKVGDGYVIIDGERRWRAIKMLGLKTIEAYIVPASNHNRKDRLLKALVANVQRSGNSPLEEARAYQRLITIYGSRDLVAKKVGVSIATISLRLALLEFDPVIQRLFDLKRIPLDCKVVSALKGLPDELKIKVATSAAIRGMVSKTILAVCTRIMVQGEPAYHPVPRRRQAVKTAGHFDALAMVNNRTPEYISGAARQTCISCALYQDASEISCRECPLVDFLRRLELAAPVEKIDRNCDVRVYAIQDGMQQ